MTEQTCNAQTKVAMNQRLHHSPRHWITLTVVLTSLLAGSYRLPAQALGVFRELWTGVAQQGNSLLYLTNTTYNPNWPDNPNSAYTTNLATLETLPGLGNYYGERLRTYLVPATNGNYTFWIASDDYSILYLNTNSVAGDDPAGMNQICWANVTGQDVYTAQSNQKSVAIPLLGGHRYYMEARMEQGTGGEYVSVAWADNANNTPTVIGGSYVQLDQVINIAAQPTNTTVTELTSATFNVRVSNFGQPGYQWRQGTTPIPGATNATLVIPYVFFTNNGTTYACLLTNTLSTNLSSYATLTVRHDTNPPVLGLAADVSPTNIWVNYSKIMDPATATNATNYAVSGGLTVFGASMFGPQSVVLLVSPLTLGSNYTVTVNNVTDPAYVPNVIAPNSQTNFVARGFAPWDIGSPVPPGSSAVQANGLDVTGGGRGIGDVSDQFQFDFQARTGDFDVQVQVQGLNMADVWAKAGLMARESVNSGSPFAATFATPTMAGCFFESRTSLSNASSMAGSFQVNLPNTWLRLQRLGAVFNGYASYDGSNWVQLGSVSLTDGLVYVGYAVTSHNTNQAATAQFRGFADVTGGTLGTFTLPGEPLQACSRRTTLVISEIMYKPAARSDSNNLEYMEVYNSNPYYEDLSGYQIGGGDISFTFPPNTILAGGAFLVVAASPSSMQNVYGIQNVTGPYTGSLKKAGLIQLSDPAGVILLEVPYSNLPPWPVGAQGTGHSIVLARPSFGEGNGAAWALSDVVGGSPGRAETYHPSPLRQVVINEFLANSGTNYLDFIELYNHSAAPVNISGCILTDDALTNKFIIPTNTILPAGGFVYYNENQMGFGLNASGQSIFFKNPDNSRILNAVTYEDQSFGISFGRWPDGAADWYPLAAQTPGASNTNILVRDIVINELMYKPISGNDDDQYLELFNKGASSVDLTGWKFTAGISFTFPSNTVLAPNGYLVLARNMTNLFAHYTNLNPGNTVGNFGGTLAHKGERVALAQPEAHVTTNAGALVTNTLYIVVDEVTYRAGGRWGQWSGGGGSSLELVNPNTNHRLPFNWGDSDETRKSAWTNLEYSGVLDLGANYTGGADMVQVGLLDVGECLVDNIEVRPGTSGANYVANSTFESGLTNWVMQGDHMRSGLESALGGYASSQCLRLRSSDGAWTLADYAQGTLTNGTLAAGGTATLRLKARWLRGWPEVLMRLRGNWLEVTGALPLPANLGTPGQRNSRYLPSVGPAIYEIQHAPALPSATQPVVVTARFHDFKGFQPTLLWRVDVGNNPAPSYTVVPMVDDGTGGDALAQDGLFSATIPGQSSGTVVAFLVQAQNPLGASTIFPMDLKDNAGVPRECVVGFGDAIPTGSFMHHHMFITQNWANRWGNGGGVSHELHDFTWVDGGSGRIIYDATGRYAGSPYHQYLGSPIGTVGGMHWIMPDDDQVMGTTTFNKQHVPGNGPLDDDTLQREQASFWMARRIGLVWENRRYYVCYVNGNRHGPLMEDAQVPGADLLKQYFPNDNNGWLYKNHSWFEGDYLQQANGNMPFNNYSWCLLGKFTTTINGVPNQYKLARYRWMWWIRQFPDSANNFSNVFALITAANTPTNTAAYYTNMESMVDTEEWMRLSAMEHATGDWDSFFTQNQWNMYCYKPTQGKWTALKWDWNITLGGGTSTWGPDGSQLFTVGAGAPDPVMAAFQSYSPYRRAYLRAFKEIAAKAMNNTYVDPMLDSKYAAFAANGLANTAWGGMTVKDPGMPNGLKSWIATMNMSLLTALTNQGVANVAFLVTGGTNFNVASNVFSLSGIAPVEIKTIALNGVAQPVLWTSPTNWTVSLVLHRATNVLALQGYDVYGALVTIPSPTVTVNVTNLVPAAQGTVVINEIMYNPVVPGTQYVEIFNTSSNFTFDLSNWRFDKLGYTFALGSTLPPRSFLTLVKDRNAFTNAYGTSIAVFDQFAGSLGATGDTLTLYMPGTPPGPDFVVVDKVKYENVAPWPTRANGGGSSLQLYDVSQDRSRPANWYDHGDWRFAYATGNASPVNRLIIQMDEAGDVYLDDLTLVPGAVAQVGTNFIRNGDFESALLEKSPVTNSWYVGVNYTNSAISTAFKHSGNSSVHVVCAVPTTILNLLLYQMLSPAPTNTQLCTLSFWYLGTTNTTNTIWIREQSSATLSVRVSMGIPAPYTPGAINSLAQSLPAFPPLWLNEVQPQNVNGITNSAGQHAPWLELYNAGTNQVSLAGLYLANNFTNLAQWAFPTNAVINPGEFKVIFADGQTNLSTTNELHTGFQLGTNTGSVALSRVRNAAPEVLDYINFSGIHAGYSYGSYPDGQPFDRQEFFYSTPGSTNNGTLAPLPVFINEWMAANTTTLLNPATQKYDDWFELYNASSNTVNLAGYYLTDTITNKFLFLIPAGFTIPPHGYRLVWADKQTNYNLTQPPDLHGSFKLSKSGTSIGLFGADGTQVDWVSFGSQTANVSEGRCPDGDANIVTMPGPTPRAANLCATNTPPMMAYIADRYVYLGETLLITNHATDLESPPEVLTFTLDPGAPLGAGITGDGLFSWTPSPAQAPSANHLTVRVTDNGLPPLAVAQTFSIFVLTQPALASPSLNGNNLVLSWPTVSGRNYQLAYKTNLADTVWTPYGSSLPGNGSNLVKNLDLTQITAPQQFFRIVVVP